MALPRDTVWGDRAPLAEGERVVVEFPADRITYWRGHVVMAVILGFVAGVALLVTGNPAPWVGPVAAMLAIMARAAFLVSEALAGHWALTDRRLIGPGGRAIALTSIRSIRPFLGDVMVVTATGDKHLMKYMADPAAVIAAVDRQRGLA